MYQVKYQVYMVGYSSTGVWDFGTVWPKRNKDRNKTLSCELQHFLSQKSWENHQTMYYFFALHNIHFDFKIIISNLQRIYIPICFHTIKYYSLLFSFSFSMSDLNFQPQKFSFSLQHPIVHSLTEHLCANYYIALTVSFLNKNEVMGLICWPILTSHIQRLFSQLKLFDRF